VPQGVVTKYTWTSQIFPGTVRDYWVYVPAQYTPEKPACVMLFEDGTSYVKESGRARIPIVFDNLIARHEMPVTIAILIDPGVLKAPKPDQADRLNRSYEYDALSDRYARFLLDEILPEVAKHYNLSTNPNDRAISGGSSGRNLLLHGRVDASGSLSPRAELHRQLRRPAWRRHLPRADPQDGAETDSRFPFRTATTTSITLPATGGWPINPWHPPSPTPGMTTSL